MSQLERILFYLAGQQKGRGGGAHKKKLNTTLAGQKQKPNEAGRGGQWGVKTNNQTHAIVFFLNWFYSTKQRLLTVGVVAMIFFLRIY